MANPFSAIKAFTEGGDLPIINSWVLYYIKISKKKYRPTIRKYRTVDRLVNYHMVCSTTHTWNNFG